MDICARLDRASDRLVDLGLPIQAKSVDDAIVEIRTMRKLLECYLQEKNLEDDDVQEKLDTFSKI